LSDARVYVDPTGERDPAHRERIARPASLDGLTIGLLDISKARGDVWFATHLEVVEWVKAHAG